MILTSDEVSDLHLIVGTDARLGSHDENGNFIPDPELEARIDSILADPNWRERALALRPVPDASPLQLFDEMDETHGIDLETEIGALSQKALRRFRLAREIKPTDQFASALQARLGWTDAQVGALFRAAAAR